MFKLVVCNDMRCSGFSSIGTIKHSPMRCDVMKEQDVKKIKEATHATDVDIDDMYW